MKQLGFRAYHQQYLAKNPGGDPADAGADPADAGADNGQDTVDTPGEYPNVSKVLGYPWSGVAPFEKNPGFWTAGQSEAPYGTDATGPGHPATTANCAGNPALCGSDGTKDCTSKSAINKWMHRTTIDTGAYPKAVCADGSPGLIED